jgi:hypothetical protein
MTPQSIDTFPSHVEIENKVRDLLRVMGAREVGLSTWQKARLQTALELHKMLGKVLGVSSDYSKVPE